MGNIVYITLEYFLVYSFLGWCVEVAYQAVAKGIVVNRGFLNGPVCPIYGIGVLAVFRLLEAVGSGDLNENNPIMVFIFGIILATLIELIGGWALDKLFHARWWDYSNERFNFHGYICLRFSIIWGIGILLVVDVVNPLIMDLLDLVPKSVGWIVIGVCMAGFVADLAVSVMIMVGLNKRMAEIDELRAKMRVVSDTLSEHIGEGTLDTMQQVGQVQVQTALARAELKEQAEQVKKEYDEEMRELRSRIQKRRFIGTGRLLRAFPDLKPRDHEELMEGLRDFLK